jgi:Rrf2 family protein
MIVSTRGRYALRVMIDLAEQNADGLVPLKDIVARQGLSLKYLETIMTTLSKAGLVVASHGKGGGYRLSRKPEEYKITDILEVTEKSIVPASCAECVGENCPRKDDCRTLPFWEKFNGIVDECLNTTTLADLMKE